MIYIYLKQHVCFMVTYYSGTERTSNYRWERKMRDYHYSNILQYRSQFLYVHVLLHLNKIYVNIYHCLIYSCINMSSAQQVPYILSHTPQENFHYQKHIMIKYDYVLLNKVLDNALILVLLH